MKYNIFRIIHIYSTILKTSIDGLYRKKRIVIYLICLCRPLLPENSDNSDVTSIYSVLYKY